MEPGEAYYEYGDPCRDLEHTDFCRLNVGPDSCIEERLSTARRIEKNIKRLGLMKECALDPSYADRLTYSTLNGMAVKDSPIVHG